MFCMFPGRGKGQASGFDDVDPMISRHLSTGLTCVFSVTDEPAFISQAHLVVNEVLVKPVSKARLILLWFVQVVRPSVPGALRPVPWQHGSGRWNR